MTVHVRQAVRGRLVACSDDEIRQLTSPRVNRKQWERLGGEKRSRGKLAAGLGAVVSEHKIVEIYAGDARSKTTSGGSL